MIAVWPRLPLRLPGLHCDKKFFRQSRLAVETSCGFVTSVIEAATEAT